METIFEKLDELRVCYALAMNYDYLKNIDVDAVSKSYFVIISKSDLKKADGLGFKKIQDSRQHIAEFDISDSEAKKAIRSDKFIKVKENEHGMVWELKTKSFKQYMQLKKNMPKLKRLKYKEKYYGIQ